MADDGTWRTVTSHHQSRLWPGRVAPGPLFLFIPGGYNARYTARRLSSPLQLSSVLASLAK